MSFDIFLKWIVLGKKRVINLSFRRSWWVCLWSFSTVVTQEQGFSFWEHCFLISPFPLSLTAPAHEQISCTQVFCYWPTVPELRSDSFPSHSPNFCSPIFCSRSWIFVNDPVKTTRPIPCVALTDEIIAVSLPVQITCQHGSYAMGMVCLLSSDLTGKVIFASWEYFHDVIIWLICLAI